MALKLLLVLAAAGAGVAGAFQAAANAGLSARTGLGAALVVNTTIVLLGTNFLDTLEAPPYVAIYTSLPID